MPTPGAAVVAAVAQSYGGDHQMIDRILFGPPPQTDADLLGLAQALDAIRKAGQTPPAQPIAEYDAARAALLAVRENP